jgi:DNA-binding response OmpR family regulator
MRTVLENSGYDTLEAADGFDAWQAVKNHGGRIRLLVTDFDLHGINGGSLAELARELWPGLPVLLLSDLPYSHIMSMCPKLGAVSFLRKPFRPDDLIAVVASLLAPVVQADSPRRRPADRAHSQPEP